MVAVLELIFMPMEEYHALMLNSCIAATLCMALISIIISQKRVYVGIWAFMTSVWMFSLAWLSVMLYVVGFKSLWLILCNKGFLFAGCIFFLRGLCSFTKVILEIYRHKKIEESKLKLKRISESPIYGFRRT